MSARPDGGRARVLVGRSGEWGFGASQWERPAWSPDGRRLAFTADMGAYASDRDIWVMRADGSSGRG